MHTSGYVRLPCQGQRWAVCASSSSSSRQEVTNDMKITDINVPFYTSSFGVDVAVWKRKQQGCCPCPGQFCSYQVHHPSTASSIPTSNLHPSQHSITRRLTKTDAIQDFIMSSKVDVLALTEMWHANDPLSSQKIAEISS